MNDILLDNYNRYHDYLRISLTDYCNFRCVYCIPNENFKFLPKQAHMQTDELLAIAKIFIQLGINKIRFTGGEPLVRKDFPLILDALNKEKVKICLTTNAYYLKHYFDILTQNNIHSINISLDTLQAKKFNHITQRNVYQQVWDNILTAINLNFHIKLNMVVIKGFNDEELIDFVTLTQKYPIHIRFIEFMPFDKNDWRRDDVMTYQQMYQKISTVYPAIIKLNDDLQDTTKKFQLKDAIGTFAFITTISQPFCEGCNRIRLTADGKIKNCLFGKDEINLLDAYRNKQALEPLIKQAISLKKEKLGGQFSDFSAKELSKAHNRSMIKIGG